MSLHHLVVHKMCQPLAAPWMRRLPVYAVCTLGGHISGSLDASAPWTRALACALRCRP